MVSASTWSKLSKMARIGENMKSAGENNQLTDHCNLKEPAVSKYGDFADTDDLPAVLTPLPAESVTNDTSPLSSH